MSQSLTQALMDVQLQLLLTDTQADSNATDRYFSGGALLPSFRRTLQSGTGAGFGNKVWHKQTSLAFGASANFIMRGGGSNILDRWNNAISFTLVKWFLIRIQNPAAGVKLTLGNATQPWKAWMTTAANTWDVAVQDFKVSDLDGWAVVAGDTLKVVNPAGAGVPVVFDLAMVGEG